jgi:capsid protein
VIDEFIKDNKWGKRQQETQWRNDRDGETILRLFRPASTDDDGIQTTKLKVRFVEPGQLSTPPARQAANETFGIVTDSEDVETVTGYWIDGKLVPAKEIQHRKRNVDLNVKRGLPLFLPVEKNLRRAEKLLRNMTTVASIQSAIALIRKHSGAATETSNTNFVQDHANYSVQHGSQPTTYHERFAAGTILDAPAATEYDFPTATIDASQYVVVLQAELRAVACRLQMPEFMLTADASNANYSSTMVAEGPAVKSFERNQATMIEEDLEIFDIVLDLGVGSGMISQEQRDQVDIDVTPPTVQTRDRIKETTADQILVNGKAMSIDTWQLRNELDPEHETELIDAQTEKNMANMEPFGGMTPLVQGGDSQQRGTIGGDNGNDNDVDD